MAHGHVKKVIRGKRREIRPRSAFIFLTGHSLPITKYLNDVECINETRRRQSRDEDAQAVLNAVCTCPENKFCYGVAQEEVLPYLTQLFGQTYLGK